MIIIKMLFCYWCCLFLLFLGVLYCYQMQICVGVLLMIVCGMKCVLLWVIVLLFLWMLMLQVWLFIIQLLISGQLFLKWVSGWVCWMIVGLLQGLLLCWVLLLVRCILILVFLCENSGLCIQFDVSVLLLLKCVFSRFGWFMLCCYSSGRMFLLFSIVFQVGFSSCMFEVGSVWLNFLVIRFFSGYSLNSVLIIELFSVVKWLFLDRLMFLIVMVWLCRLVCDVQLCRYLIVSWFFFEFFIVLKYSGGGSCVVSLLKCLISVLWIVLNWLVCCGRWLVLCWFFSYCYWKKLVLNSEVGVLQFSLYSLVGLVLLQVRFRWL